MQPRLGRLDKASNGRVEEPGVWRANVDRAIPS
jgi:hypothetical protein